MASQINTNRLCDDITDSTCLAAAAGLYNPDSSESSFQNYTNSTALFSDWEWRSEVAQTKTWSERGTLDIIGMNVSGISLTTLNNTIAAMDAVSFNLPSGDTYTAEVGHLALGAPGNGTFVYDSGVTGQTFPGVLAARGTIPSNSFGLHYGSASLNAIGSLTWGGYDQSRVLGDVASYELHDVQYGQNNMILSLLDIQIGVETGDSPFNGTSFTNLLQINSTYGFNGGQLTNINPILPYMYMDPATCAAIAQHLPVTPQDTTGLYIWNTTSPLYSSIINSPSYLAFVFATSGPSNITIKIPFQLLNLTLDAPVASPPTQYFPCKPFHATDFSNHYFFGKAFLQAAFLGMNWEQSRFFLAQAPGPAPAAPNLQSIESGDTTIHSDPIASFAQSWKKNWTPIEASTGNSSQASASAPGPAAPGEFGLSAGAKAGIAVGTILGVFVLTALVVLLCLRRRRGAKRPVKHGKIPREELSGKQSENRNFETLEKDGQGLDPELVGKDLSHEVDGTRQIHELHTR